jgi:hypothetical protein
MKRNLIKSVLNTDHVIALAAEPDRKLFMIVNPAQNLISYKICLEKGGDCSIRDLDRAIDFYNKIGMQ